VATSSSCPCPGRSCLSAGVQPGARGHGVFAQAQGHGCCFPLCNSEAPAVPRLSVYPRHTQTHRYTQRTLTQAWLWLHRRSQTRRCPQQHARWGLTPDTGTERHLPSSSWASGGRRSPVQHTPHTLQVHKHTHVQGSPEHRHDPSVPPAPLPGSRPPLPTSRVPDPSADPAWSLPANPHAHLTHTQFGEATDTCPQQLTSSTWVLRSCSSVELFTHPGPP